MKISKSSIESAIINEYYLSNPYLTVKINKSNISGIFGSDNGKYIESISIDQDFESAVYHPNMIVFMGQTEVEYVLSHEKPALAILLKGSKFKMKVKVSFQKDLRVPVIEKILHDEEEYRVFQENKKINFIGKGKQVSMSFENTKFKMIRKEDYFLFEISPQGKAWVVISFGNESNFSKDIYRSNLDYINYLEEKFDSKEKILNSLFVFSLHTALSNYKHGIEKHFSALFAGPNYSLPPRTYYRDSFWTSKALLPFEPLIVKNQILSLLDGISERGTAPSGIIFASESEVKRYEEFIKLDPRIAEFQKNPRDWWSDHWDSPFFFVILVYDYLRWSGDREILTKDILQKIRIILDRFEKDNWLFVKDEDTKDWSDNVVRSGFVTYDLALYAGALNSASKIFDLIDGDLAKKYMKGYKIVKKFLNERMWKKDHFIDYINEKTKKAEEHINIDTAITLLYDIADSEEVFINALKKYLFTKNNNEQKFGNWGIMSVWPFYKYKEDLKSKSAFPYRYHNGSDWPYWDGVIAKILLSRSDPEWRYALLKSWEYSLSNKWYLPVEYYSPPFGRGGLLQAWSATPVWAIISGGFGIEPDLNGNFSYSTPPWGKSNLKFKLHGKDINLD
ncbi:amylo-alpha-1,6-glucosidase [Athalassotoga sp.]|uniref:Glycogen debranching enzyme C-terminal domain-containing protein n=1 Tax=Caldisericum exile TaxID=693075 RepID=A0A2J6X9F1_9BACT|nr:MAG: hypothetical protein C0175_00855 [Caldisericum exile]